MRDEFVKRFLPLFINVLVFPSVHVLGEKHFKVDQFLSPQNICDTWILINVHFFFLPGS